jgi:ubiquinone/menaquinone biosynthesis C-methylase UbiE
MRREAERHCRHPRVSYVKGTAEELGVDEAAFDAAWLSMVAHHVRDLAACARQLRRAIRPGGLVFVRNCFSGRLRNIPLYDYIPAARPDAPRPVTEDIDLLVFRRDGRP